MKNIKNATQKGFTLIELLVVVAIIAILALIVLLALNPVEMARRSRDSRRMSDVGTLRKAIDLALADGESLPSTGGNWVNLDTTITVKDFPNTTASTPPAGMVIEKYLSVVPGDPYTGSSATQLTTSAGCGATTPTYGSGTPAYEFKSNGDTYVIRARMESGENCSAITGDGLVSDYYELGTYPGLNI